MVQMSAHHVSQYCNFVIQQGYNVVQYARRGRHDDAYRDPIYCHKILYDIPVLNISVDIIIAAPTPFPNHYNLVKQFHS